MATLLLHLPQAEHTAEHVAAPQQLAPAVRRVPTLGTARRGSDSRAPIVPCVDLGGHQSSGGGGGGGEEEEGGGGGGGGGHFGEAEERKVGGRGFGDLSRSFQIQ